MVKYQHQRKEKPLLVWAQDNSQSLLLNEDSIYLKSQYPKQLSQFRNKMEDRFDFHLYKFGSGVQEVDSFDYSDQHSDFSELFTRLRENFPPNTPGAMVLVSDGAFNKGNHPRYAIQGFPFPVYTVNMGDTTTHSDVVLSDLHFNRIAFLNQQVPVRCNISATHLSSQKVNLRVKQGQKVVYQEQIEIEGADFYRELDFMLTPSNTGFQTYLVELLPVQGEFSLRNNSRKMVIDVLDSRRKILMLHKTYHPDMAAMKSAIEGNENMEVVYRNVEQPVDSVEAYDLVILNQLPSLNENAANWLQALREKKTPLLFMVGGSTNLSAFSMDRWGIEFKVQPGQYEEVRGIWQSNFTLFEMEEEERNTLETFPPLLVPFGDIAYAPNADVLLNQKIKSVTTNSPLLLFTERDGQKIGWILGEGIWRWKLHNYLQEQDHRVYSNFINRMIQYLALKERKDRMVVQMKRNYSEVESIIPEVQLYNQSYELVNQPDVVMEIKDADQKLFRYNLSRTLDSYRLNLGNLPVGVYQYKASTLWDGRELVREGSFVVTAEDMEALGVPANHRVLNQLAVITGGKSFVPSQLKVLEKELKDNADLRPVMYKESFFDTVLNYTFLGIVFLMLMSLEWFLKRFWGGY
jgi:hypothetical protein